MTRTYGYLICCGFIENKCIASMLARFLLAIVEESIVIVSPSTISDAKVLLSHSSAEFFQDPELKISRPTPSAKATLSTT
jgi:hypothetical protein